MKRLLRRCGHRLLSPKMIAVVLFGALSTGAPSDVFAKYYPERLAAPSGKAVSSVRGSIPLSAVGGLEVGQEQTRAVRIAFKTVNRNLSRARLQQIYRARAAQRRRNIRRARNAERVRRLRRRLKRTRQIRHYQAPAQAGQSAYERRRYLNRKASQRRKFQRRRTLRSRANRLRNQRGNRRFQNKRRNSDWRRSEARNKKLWNKRGGRALNRRELLRRKKNLERIRRYGNASRSGSW